MSALERNPEVPASNPDEDIGPDTDWRGIPIFLLKLEKKQEFLPSRQDEALLSYGVLREIPPSLLSLERVLDALDATQEVPRQTHVHSRGTGSVLPQLEKFPVFPSSSQDKGPYPCFIGKAIMVFPSHLKRKRTQLESRENSRVHATIPKEPDVPNHFRYT